MQLFVTHGFEQNFVSDTRLYTSNFCGSVNYARGGIWTHGHAPFCSVPIQLSGVQVDLHADDRPSRADFSGEERVASSSVTIGQNHPRNADHLVLLQHRLDEEASADRALEASDAGLHFDVEAAHELGSASPVVRLHEQRPTPGVAGQQGSAAFRERRFKPVEHCGGSHVRILAPLANAAVDSALNGDVCFTDGTGGLPVSRPGPRPRLDLPRVGFGLRRLGVAARAAGNGPANSAGTRLRRPPPDPNR